MQHDDVVGEEITPEEEYNVKASIVTAVTGRDSEEGGDLRFPGSQPVSLARSNLEMLNFKRYWVTWKVGSPLLHLRDMIISSSSALGEVSPLKM